MVIRGGGGGIGLKLFSYYNEDINPLFHLADSPILVGWQSRLRDHKGSNSEHLRNYFKKRRRTLMLPAKERSCAEEC